MAGSMASGQCREARSRPQSSRVAGSQASRATVAGWTRRSVSGGSCGRRRASSRSMSGNRGRATAAQNRPRRRSWRPPQRHRAALPLRPDSRVMRMRKGRAWAVCANRACRLPSQYMRMEVICMGHSPARYISVARAGCKRRGRGTRPLPRQASRGAWAVRASAGRGEGLAGAGGMLPAGAAVAENLPPTCACGMTRLFHLRQPAG